MSDTPDQPFDPDATISGPLNAKDPASGEGPEEVFDPDATLRPVRRGSAGEAAKAKDVAPAPESAPSPDSTAVPGAAAVPESTPAAAGASGEKKSFDPDATLDPVPRKFDPDITVTTPLAEMNPEATIGGTVKRRRRPNPFAPQALPEGLQANLAALGGLNPLVAFGNPVFGVLPEIRAAQRHPEPALLKETLQDLIEAFEAGTSAASMTPDTIEAAVYALCCLADDAATATPWGADWKTNGLLHRMRNETAGGEAFFTLLAEMEKNPERNADLLEFLYICLALGFEGRYRGATNGVSDLGAVRARLHGLITRRRPRPADGLSAQWRGTSVAPAAKAPARRAPDRMPWRSIAAAVAALVLLVVYAQWPKPVPETPASATPETATSSAPKHGEAMPAAAPAATAAIETPASPQGATVPAAPPPAMGSVQAAAPGIDQALADLVAGGQIGVVHGKDGTTISIRNDRQFAVGGVTPDAKMLPVIERLAAALDPMPGPIVVVGHASSEPVNSHRFPSNDALSRARADTVARLLADKLRQPQRVVVEGRGAHQPIAPNDTDVNRARNRRVEIRVPGSDTGTGKPKGAG